MKDQLTHCQSALNAGLMCLQRVRTSERDFAEIARSASNELTIANLAQMQL